LTARDVIAALGNGHVQTIFAIQNEICCLSDGNSFAHFFFGGIRFGNLQISGDRTAEEQSTLWRVADLISQHGLRHIANIDIVNSDLSFTHIEKARQKVYEGGLAAASGTND